MSRYRSHADLGAQPEYFAPIDRHDDDVAFHAPWESRALAVTLAMGATGKWNIDMSRSARETLPDYPRRSYYAIWIGALEKLLRERGLVTDDELRTLQAQAAPPLARVLRAADVPAVLQRGAPTERPASRPARFVVGDVVQTLDVPAPHHTRLPAYARDRRATVERVHGMHVFADDHAHGRGESPQWLYTVVFEGAGGVQLSVDAWEPYLRPVSA